jgi:hypothetical protein
MKVRVPGTQVPLDDSKAIVGRVTAAVITATLVAKWRKAEAVAGGNALPARPHATARLIPTSTAEMIDAYIADVGNAETPLSSWE